MDFLFICFLRNYDRDTHILWDQHPETNELSASSVMNCKTIIRQVGTETLDYQAKTCVNRGTLARIPLVS